MNQQHKSQAKVAALEAKIAEQQLHIEVLASNMFAQKQRADKLQQQLNELDELISPNDDGPDMPSGRVDYGLLTEPAFRACFFNRPLTPAEAEVIESEMGRIELAAETENAHQAAERQQLLQAAAKKPIATFTQFDYFNMNTGAIEHDKPFDVFMGRTREFNLSGCLRLLIPDDYSADDVRNALREFTDLVEDGQVESMRLPDNDIRAQVDYHDAYDAWLHSEQIPGKRQRLTHDEVQELLDSEPREDDWDIPGVSAEVGILEDGTPCVKVENSAGQMVAYRFRNGPDGYPYLQMIRKGRTENDGVPF